MGRSSKEEKQLQMLASLLIRRKERVEQLRQEVVENGGGPGRVSRVPSSSTDAVTGAHAEEQPTPGSAVKAKQEDRPHPVQSAAPANPDIAKRLLREQRRAVRRAEKHAQHMAALEQTRQKRSEEYAKLLEQQNERHAQIKELESKIDTLNEEKMGLFVLLKQVLQAESRKQAASMQATPMQNAMPFSPAYLPTQAAQQQQPFSATPVHHPATTPMAGAFTGNPLQQPSTPTFLPSNPQPVPHQQPWSSSNQFYTGYPPQQGTAMQHIHSNQSYMPPTATQQQQQQQQHVWHPPVLSSVPQPSLSHTGQRAPQQFTPVVNQQASSHQMQHQPPPVPSHSQASKLSAASTSNINSSDRMQATQGEVNNQPPPAQPVTSTSSSHRQEGNLQKYGASSVSLRQGGPRRVMNEEGELAEEGEVAMQKLNRHDKERTDTFPAPPSPASSKHGSGLGATSSRSSSHIQTAQQQQQPPTAAQPLPSLPHAVPPAATVEPLSAVSNVRRSADGAWDPVESTWDKVSGSGEIVKGGFREREREREWDRPRDRERDRDVWDRDRERDRHRDLDREREREHNNPPWGGRSGGRFDKGGRGFGRSHGGYGQSYMHGRHSYRGSGPYRGGWHGGHSNNLLRQVWE